MKNYLVVFLLFIAAFGFAQSKSEHVENIKKSKLSEVNLVTELVKDLSKDKSILMEITGKVGGKVMIATCKSNELNGEVKSILKNVDLGSKIYMDVRTDGEKSKAKTFVFLVTE